jgi:hypothetical protein
MQFKDKTRKGVLEEAEHHYFAWTCHNTDKQQNLHYILFLANHPRHFVYSTVFVTHCCKLTVNRNKYSIQLNSSDWEGGGRRGGGYGFSSDITLSSSLEMITFKCIKSKVSLFRVYHSKPFSITEI